MKLVGYSDSDFARDLDGKRSTTGMDMLGLSRRRIDIFFLSRIKFDPSGLLKTKDCGLLSGNMVSKIDWRIDE